MSKHHLLKYIFLTLFIPYISACSNLAARWTYEFEQYPLNARIHYEPGAEDLAKLVHLYFDDALQSIEKREFIDFKNASNIHVYVFNDTERYSNFSFTSPKARGSASENEIYLSPLLRDRINTLPGVIKHEISHAHLHQYIGDWKYITNIPGWYHEGLAVVSSDGAGAERVSSYEAIQEIKNQHYFHPEKTGSILGHKSARVYAMVPHMYYRQSSLFITYLQCLNPSSFEKSYIQLTKGSDFENVWKQNYDKSLDALWNDFLINLNSRKFTEIASPADVCPLS